MPWEKTDGGYRKKGKGGFVRNPDQYEALRRKGYPKDRAAAITNAVSKAAARDCNCDCKYCKHDKKCSCDCSRCGGKGMSKNAYCAPGGSMPASTGMPMVKSAFGVEHEVAKASTLTPTQLKQRRRLQAGIYTAGAGLGLTALGSKAGAASMRRFVKPVERGEALADKLEHHTSTALAGGAGLGAVSGINQAKISRTEAGSTRVSKTDDAMSSYTPTNAQQALSFIARGSQKLAQLSSVATPQQAATAAVTTAQKATTGAGQVAQKTPATTAAVKRVVKPLTGQQNTSTVPTSVLGKSRTPLTDGSPGLAAKLRPDTKAVQSANKLEPLKLKPKQVARHPVRSGYAVGAASERKRAVVLEDEANRARFNSDTLNRAAKSGLRRAKPTSYRKRPQYHYSKPRQIGL